LPDFGSDQLKRNGFTTGGKQKYKCKACGRYGSLNLQQSYPHEVRDQVLSAYLERPSIRGLERTFDINRLTITSWIKKAKSLPSLSEKLLPAQSADVLELDEFWSFV
jgi:transposase-like protein